MPPRKKKTKGSKTKFLDFLSFRKKRDDEVDGEEMDEMKEHDVEEGEEKLKKLIDSKEGSLAKHWNLDDIIEIVTAKNLCSCQDPITMAFKVNCTLRKLAKTNTENNNFLNKLADQAEDFAVELIDQVNANEELVIRDVPTNVDRYASLLGGMTDDAIVHSQKKFVSHPLLYKRLKMRWNLGLPEFFKKHHALLVLLILIDTALTPFLLPVVGFAFLRDQRKCQKQKMKTREQSQVTPLTAMKSQDVLDKYYAYFTNPFVIFVKDKLSQLVFIGLHVSVCILPSYVKPKIEEYLIFVFFCGLVLSECQQYKTSPLKYFKDMWNYVDIITLVIYVLIVALRIAIIARGGVPFHNRLLEIVNYLYGVNTLFLILRFSSILELSSVVGPLQLALFRMCVDLFIILIQFCFVICGFSMAIVKSYKAELSYEFSPASNHTGIMTKYQKYCDEGALLCLTKTSKRLIWSVFGLTELRDMKTSYFVGILYCVFMILSVIMLVNMLVALLTKTYDNVTTNAEVEWKFSSAVVENQCRKLHSIVVPFNLLTVPGRYFLLRGRKDARKEEAENRQKTYRRYYKERLFPVITGRYKEKYGGSFPLSIEEKIDLIMDKLKISTSGETTSQKQRRDSCEDLISDINSVTIDLRGSRNHLSPLDAMSSSPTSHEKTSAII